MGRIDPKNPRYRTLKEIAQDIRIALRSELTWGGKFDILNAAMWAWTERDGKYRGCPCWTRKAIDSYKLDRNTRVLRHEHVVPRNCLMAMLRDLPNKTPESVFELLDRYLMGVVVTQEEDKALAGEYARSMPTEFEACPDVLARDPWLRYKR